MSRRGGKKGNAETTTMTTTTTDANDDDDVQARIAAATIAHLSAEAALLAAGDPVTKWAATRWPTAAPAAHLPSLHQTGERGLCNLRRRRTPNRFGKLALHFAARAGFSGAVGAEQLVELFTEVSGSV